MSETTIASIPQPPPVHNDNPSCHDLVIADMIERKQFGLNKYGTILQPGNGRDFLVDAYQEILDMAVYVRGAIYEQQKLEEMLIAAYKRGFYCGHTGEVNSPLLDYLARAYVRRTIAGQESA